MSTKKKYQIFVSSTYLDLKDERQAAVTAVLSSGNIPAGMELFASGDEEQMDLIEQWIDDSDIYFLILGTRYGSVEQKTGLSYTHREYEYAISKKMPFFALVIDESTPNYKEKVEENNIETLNKYYNFRGLIEGKHIRYWKNIEQMQFEILKSINHFERTKLMDGWVKGSGVYDYGQMADQLSKLSAENNDLRVRLAAYIESINYNGLSFDELMNLLSESIEADLKRNLSKNHSAMNEMVPIRNFYRQADFTLLHYLWIKRNQLSYGGTYSTIDEFIIGKLYKYGLIRYDDSHVN